MEKKVNEFSLYETLNKFECPCNWKIPNSIFSHNDIIESKMFELQSKIKDIERKEQSSNDFLWRKYVLCVSLSFFSFEKDKKDDALEMIDKALATLEAPGIKSEFFEANKSALFHVVLAMRGRIYFDQGDFVKAKEMSDKVKDQSSMNNVDKAALLGIKTSVFNEFGPEASFKVLDDIRQAVKLNEREAEWKFILGKILRRIRKLSAYFEIPDKEEITVLQNAYEMKKCSSYCLYLAIAYQELSTKLFQKVGMEQFGDKIRSLNENSMKLFREALSYDDLSPTTYSKVSRGFSQFPFPLKDVETAKELALKAVEMNDTSPITLHTLAMHYERHDLDFENALKFNIKALEAGSFGSGMDIIKINLRKNPSYDPLPILNELKEKFTGRGHMNETLMQEACYYLVMKGDLNKALEMFLTIIDETPNLHVLNVWKPIWLQVRKPISMYEVLYHELRSSRCNLAKGTSMNALMKIKQVHPELFEKDVDENFLDNLKKESEEIVKKIAKKKPFETNRYKNLHVDQDGRYVPQRDRVEHSNSNNWRSRGRTDGSNSFGDKRYDNSRNYNQNRTAKYENSRNLYDNQSGHEGNSRSSRNDNFSTNENRNNWRSDRQLEDKRSGSKSSYENSNKAKEQKSDSKNPCPANNTNESNNSRDRQSRHKSNDRNNQNRPRDKSNRSKSAKGLTKEKSFEKKYPNEKIPNVTKENNEKKDAHFNQDESTGNIERKSDQSSSNLIFNKASSVSTERAERKNSPENTEGTHKSDSKLNRHIEKVIEFKDHSYDENPNPGEEEYRRKMYGKLNRQAFLEQMKNLNEKVKKDTLQQWNKTSNAPESKREKVSKETDIHSNTVQCEVNISNVTRELDRSSTATDFDILPSNLSCEEKSRSESDLIVDQMTHLSIGINPPPSDRSEVFISENSTSKDQETIDGEGAVSDNLLGQISQLSKDEIKFLMKIVKKPKKKQAMKVKENIDNNDAGISNEDNSDTNVLPPPKLLVMTAGNIAIRQPSGPSENNFALRKK